MSTTRSLSGSCQCQRNQFYIEFPANASSAAQVLFTDDSLHGRLRVPLGWYHSRTIAFFPDEEHHMIRRLFEPATGRPTKRYHCGMCGDTLSLWTESPRSEADFIQVALATLCDEDLGDLEEMGLLPSSDEATPEDTDTEMDTGAVGTLGTKAVVTTSNHREIQGVPWFEDLIEGSRLGRMRRRHGVNESRDGTRRVEWEIVEWTEGEQAEDEDEDEGEEEGGEDVDMVSNPGKRKRSQRADSDALAQGAR